MTVDKLRRLQTQYIMAAQDKPNLPRPLMSVIHRALSALTIDSQIDGAIKPQDWLEKVVALEPNAFVMHSAEALLCAGVLEFFLARPKDQQKKYGIVDVEPTINMSEVQAEYLIRLQQERLRQQI